MIREQGELPNVDPTAVASDERPFTVIRSGEVFPPEALERRDLLVCGERIVAIGEGLVDRTRVLLTEDLMADTAFVRRRIMVQDGRVVAQGPFEERDTFDYGP